MVIAAGNDGAGHSLHTVGSLATAKNITSVGASQSSGPDISSGMYGEDYLVDFSSRGPTGKNTFVMMGFNFDLILSIT